MPVELDGEHYGEWIKEQRRIGKSDSEIIELLFAYNKGRYDRKTLQRHIDEQTSGKRSQNR